MASTATSTTSRLRLSPRSARVGASSPARPPASRAHRTPQPAVAPRLVTLWPRALPDETASVVEHLTAPFSDFASKVKNVMALVELENQRRIKVKKLGATLKEEQEILEQLKANLAERERDLERRKALYAHYARTSYL